MHLGGGPLGLSPRPLGSALRVGDWKIVSVKNGAWELYDLSTDRTEMKNLAEEKPERVREMAAMWTKQLEEYAGQAKDAK